MLIDLIACGCAALYFMLAWATAVYAREVHEQRGGEEIMVGLFWPLAWLAFIGMWLGRKVASWTK